MIEEFEWERIREDAEVEDRWIPLGNIPCESPIERMLARELVPHAQRWGFEVVEQFKLGPFRYDFAISKAGEFIAVVECDGAEFHASRSQRARDARKDHLAEQHGLEVFRFTGRQIHFNAWKCAEEIIFRVWRP